MQTPIEDEDAFNFDDFTTFSERVKNTTQETANKLESRLNNKIDKILVSFDKKFISFNKSVENKVTSLDSNIEK